MSDTSCVRTHRARTLAAPRLHDDRQGSCPSDRIMASSRPRCSQAAQGCPEQLAPIAEAHTQILEILSDQLRQNTCAYAAARDPGAMPRCPRLPSRLGHCSPLQYLKFWCAGTLIAPCPRPNSLDNRLSVHGYYRSLCRGRRQPILAVLVTSASGRVSCKRHARRWATAILSSRIVLADMDDRATQHAHPALAGFATQPRRLGIPSRAPAMNRAGC